MQFASVSILLILIGFASACNIDAGFGYDSLGRCVFPTNAGICPKNQVDCQLGCVDENDDIPNNICRGGTCVDGVCVQTPMNSTIKAYAEGIIRTFINNRRQGANGVPQERFKGDYVGGLVRAAFHSVANKKAQACLLVTDCKGQPCEFTSPHNVGLEYVILSIKDLYASNNLGPLISLQDFFYLATTVVVDVTTGGDIKIPFKWNHSPCACLDYSPAAGEVCADLPNFPDALPGPEMTFAQLTNIMETQFGFTRKEWFCLLGAHALGRADPDATGYARHWVSNPDQLKNTFYKMIAGNRWCPEFGRQDPANIVNLDVPLTGQQQYAIRGKQDDHSGPFMLVSDLNMFFDMDSNRNCTVDPDNKDANPRLCPKRNSYHSSFGGKTAFQVLTDFVNNPAGWQTCFRNAYIKMIEIGESNLRTVNLAK